MRAQGEDVFINCPFDTKYRELFWAQIFCIFHCGYRPCCAMEIQDGGDARIEKIYRLIKKCRLGIHDISRTEVSEANGLPRFNMPFELGLFCGAKKFGSGVHKKKLCLVLDSDRYRFQEFISDLAGMDISAHSNDPKKVILLVRTWLKTNAPEADLPSASEISRNYKKFRADLKVICSSRGEKISKLIYADYCMFADVWLKDLMQSAAAA